MNFTSRKWKILLASGDYPSPRTFHNTVYLNEVFYLIGGYSNKLENDIIKLNINLVDFCDSNNTKEITKSILDLNVFEMTNEEKNNLILKLQATLNELKIKYDEEVAKNKCKICYENEINTIILECNHRYMCHECYLKCGDRCPLCKKEIIHVIKTYN